MNEMKKRSRVELANIMVNLLEESVAPNSLSDSRENVIEAIKTFAEQDDQTVDPSKFSDIELAIRARKALQKASAAWRRWQEKDPDRFREFVSRSRKLGFDPTWLIQNDDVPEIFRPKGKRGRPLDAKQENRLWIAEHLWKEYGPNSGYRGERFLHFVQIYSELVTQEPSSPEQFRSLIARRHRI